MGEKNKKIVAVISSPVYCIDRIENLLLTMAEWDNLALGHVTMCYLENSDAIDAVKTAMDLNTMIYKGSKMYLRCTGYEMNVSDDEMNTLLFTWVEPENAAKIAIEKFKDKPVVEDLNIYAPMMKFTNNSADEMKLLVEEYQRIGNLQVESFIII